MSGMVTDPDGLPVIGANILVKGTSAGTISDLDGQYSLEVTDENATLVFSYTGYQPLEIEIAGREVIDVQMEEGAVLDEVVVIGYGSVKKSDLTGSVSSISGKELGKLAPVSSFDALLDGKVAGVQIQRTDGAPGGNVNVVIRGVSSVTGGNQPLYVIDGFPYVPGGNSNGTNFTAQSYSSSNLASQGVVNRLNPLSFLNQNDIESIEVLKDASATAIYGSRGANGVVIITTKRGKKGKGRINFDVSYGMQELEKKIELLNGAEYAEFVRDGRNNAYLLGGGSRSADDPNSVRPGSQQFPDPYRNPAAVTTVTDWQDEIYRTAPIGNYQISFSGGGENVRYLISGGLLDQQGIIQGSDFKRYNARINLDGNLRSNLSVGLSLNAYRTEGNFARTDGHYGRRNVVTAALAANPTIPVYDKNGEFTQLYTGFPSNENPPFAYSEGLINPLLAINEFSDYRKSYGTLLNSFLEWEISESLRFRSTLGANIDQGNTRLWKSSQVGQWSLAPTPATAASHSTTTFDWLNENSLTYQKSFENHNFSILGGFTAQKSTTDFVSVAATEFGNDNVPFVSAGIVNAGNHTLNEWALLSLLGRINYDYKNKYYITATVRRDGSSRFGEDSRWGTFPSVALAYRLSEEPFMASLNAISNLKLRVSYGLSGNNQIGNYSAIGLLGSQNYVVGGSEQSGLAPVSLANPALTWEESQQINIGMDVDLFNSRISFNVDAFKDTKESMLFNVQLPTMTGFFSSTQNLGRIENKGLEMALSTVNFNRSDFRWNSQFNISFIRNEVLALGPEGEDIFGTGTGTIAITRIGYPISSFYGRQVLGIFQSQAEIDNSPMQHRNTRPGDLRFLDVNGDGMITNSDQTVIGNPWPDFTFGLNNSFSYKNFGLDVQVTGSQGNDIYAWWGQTIMNSAGVQNQWKGVANRWKSPEDPGDGLIPRSVRNGANGNWRPSSRFVFDGSFVRINNVRLTYQLPTEWLQNKGFRNVTLYANVNNLYTFTDYPGYNPAASSGGNDLQVMGFDQGNYPLSRSYIFGLQVAL